MERDTRQEALQQLLDLATAKGYVTFDDVFDCGTKFGLSIGDFDWLSESITTRNVIFYENEPDAVSTNDDDVDDYAQADYEQTFMAVAKMEPGLKQLIDDIRNIIPPQRGEVGRLKYQVKEGNAHARQRMIEMYLRVAIRIAFARARDYDLDLEATIGDAFAGLITAVDRYDPDHSGPFVSYASLWIYQNITREQTVRNTLIYYPVHRKEIYFSVYPMLKKYGCVDCDALETCPKARQMIADKAGTKDAIIEDVITAILEPLAFEIIAKQERRCDYIYESTGEKVFFPGERILHEDFDEVEETIDILVQADEIASILNEMPPRTQEILRGRLGLDDREYTLEELGQRFSLTRERVRQIEAKGMRQLVSHIRANRTTKQQQEKIDCQHNREYGKKRKGRPKQK